MSKTIDTNFECAICGRQLDYTIELIKLKPCDCGGKKIGWNHCGNCCHWNKFDEMLTCRGVVKNMCLCRQWDKYTDIRETCVCWKEKQEKEREE